MVECRSFRRQNYLQLVASGYTLEPDHFFRLDASGLCFNLLFEVDRNTETLSGVSQKAWSRRIVGYRAYQDKLLAGNRHDRTRRFRVVFLSISMEHVYNFLALVTALLPRGPRRVLYVATTIAEYLRAKDPLREPILLDHYGDWHAMIDLHPTAAFVKRPVRIPKKIFAPHVVGC